MKYTGKIYKTSRDEALIFISLFIYVLLAGLFLQKIVIPLTPWHAGHGLLAGGDWIFFHQVALDVSRAIQVEGWGAWSSNPQGQGPAGLAAMFYVLTGIYEPWILLPINAALYGLSGVAVYWIVSPISSNRCIALLSVLPMFVLPSTAIAWSQLHKDLWAITSVLLLLAYWVKLFMGHYVSSLARIILIIFVIVSLWWMRAYTLQIILLGQVVMLLILLVLKKNREIKIVLWALFSIALNVGAVYVSKVNHDNKLIRVVKHVDVKNSNLGGSNEKQVANSSDALKITERVSCSEWIYTLPIKKIDSILFNLSCTRASMLSEYPDAKSNIDPDVKFSSASDILNYVPRAMQVGMFEPGPSFFFSKVDSQSSQLLRRIAGVESFLMYIAQIGILVFFAHFFVRKTGRNSRGALMLMAVISFSIVWVLLYAFASGNLGTIYRLRLPVMLLWMALGFAGWNELYMFYKKNTLRKPV